MPNRYIRQRSRLQSLLQLLEAGEKEEEEVVVLAVAYYKEIAYSLKSHN